MSDNGLLEFLEGWNPNGLHIERNPHNVTYESLNEWVAHEVDGDNPWCEILDGEREKIFAAGSLWTLQVYPITPIGFWAKAASSLTALLTWAQNHRDD